MVDERKEAIIEALTQLEAKGLIRRTGELRDGQPVFVVTELGEMLPPEALPKGPLQ